MQVSLTFESLTPNKGIPEIMSVSSSVSRALMNNGALKFSVDMTGVSADGLDRLSGEFKCVYDNADDSKNKSVLVWWKQQKNPDGRIYSRFEIGKTKNAWLEAEPEYSTPSAADASIQIMRKLGVLEEDIPKPKF